jgi:RimJ/RimL family protein N-acetyltransferase
MTSQMTFSVVAGNGISTDQIAAFAPAQEVRPPRLVGRRFSLKPLTPEHHRAIYQMHLAEDAAFRWRYHGATPTWETFEATLNANVLVQFIVIANQEPTKPMGLVTAYNPNLQDGTVSAGILGSASMGAGVLEGFILLVGYLFDVWPLRKVYVEAPEYNVGSFASAISAGFLYEEGRLRAHRYYQGRYHDHITWTIYREDFERFSSLHPELNA